MDRFRTDGVVMPALRVCVPSVETSRSPSSGMTGSVLARRSGTGGEADAATIGGAIAPSVLLVELAAVGGGGDCCIVSINGFIGERGGRAVVPSVCDEGSGRAGETAGLRFLPGVLAGLSLKGDVDLGDSMRLAGLGVVAHCCSTLTVLDAAAIASANSSEVAAAWTAASSAEWSNGERERGERGDREGE